jgi:hypothetical protein
MIDQNYLKDRLHYNPKSGVFTWKPKAGATPAERGWNTRYAGTVAGSVQPNGYLYIGIGGRIIQAHRLAWLYVAGSWPKDQIDHADLNKLNNAFNNLRAATPSQNMANMRGRAASGFKGVTATAANRWVAHIRDGPRTVYLGTYDTPEEAHAAYAGAARMKYGKFARAA